MDERPLIVLAVGDPTTLAALLEAVQRRFGADYRVVPHLSPGARRRARTSPSSSPTSTSPR